MYIDSHCHLCMLDLTPYNNSMQELIASCKANGVDKMINISTSMDDMPEVIKIAEQFADVYASAGIHPSDDLDKVITREDILHFAAKEKVVAIGETGLDYHYNDSGFDVMQKRFAMQIELAKELQKPLIIHTRAAEQDTLGIMRECDATSAGGVMHCFTESLAMAKASLDLGFYISISGIVTFKNAANVQELASYVPLDRLLIETDAPYLTPDPYRGQANYPMYVSYVAKKIAELKNISLAEVARQTTENCQMLFNI
jgi:TatD DNase family protein